MCVSGFDASLEKYWYLFQIHRVYFKHDPWKVNNPLMGFCLHIQYLQQHKQLNGKMHFVYCLSAVISNVQNKDFTMKSVFTLNGSSVAIVIK